MINVLDNTTETLSTRFMSSAHTMSTLFLQPVVGASSALAEDTRHQADAGQR